MIPRYLRFTRALALGAGLVGCGRVSEDDFATIDDAGVDGATVDSALAFDTGVDTAVSRPDATSDTYTPPPRDTGVYDAARDTNVVAKATGTCRDTWFPGTPISCEALRTCVWTAMDPSPYVRCIDAPGTECGVIQCGMYCRCSNPAASECTCSGPVPGPLPPPDLAVA